MGLNRRLPPRSLNFKEIEGPAFGTWTQRFYNAP
ncbi:MAG: hypothetical protein QG554_1148 [Pseudomonadota bacterium]|jgi:hypothetical protein|nr:hypothetical protein [Pseudomonadota bacterium]